MSVLPVGTLACLTLVVVAACGSGEAANKSDKQEQASGLPLP
jgi:hypothetical protein